MSEMLSLSQENTIVACAVAASQELIRRTMDSIILYSDSSDEEINQIEKASVIEANIRIGNRGCREVRDEYYMNRISRFNDKVFREHFRMTRTTYENVEQRLAPALMRRGDTGRPTIPVRKQLLSVIWLLATPDSFRSVADRFNMGKSILHDSFRRVVNILNDIADDIIVWPRGEKLIAVKNKFREIGVLPNIIGAIDGTHIPIIAPYLDSECYRTRKCQYAITLQGVCTADLVFTDCFAGYSGSVNDSRVFNNSDLWRSVQENKVEFFPQNEYIIGDKAYPITTWCIPLYINRGILTEEQIKFNKMLSMIRQVIERAFSLLKGRFRRLKYLHMTLAELIPYVILAFCVLHNLCLEGYDANENADFIEAGRENGECDAFLRQNRRLRNECDQKIIDNDELGSAKRDRLAASIA